MKPLHLNLIAFITLFTLIVLIISPLAGAVVTPPEKNITMHPNKNVEVEFTIENQRNSTLFFVVHGPGSEKIKYNVTPSSGMVAPLGERSIKITFKTSAIYTKSSEDLTFTVEKYNSSGFLGRDSFVVHITLVPQGSFFFFFTLPFSEEWGHWGSFISVILTWVIIGGILYLIFPLLIKLTRKTKTKIDDILVNILKAPVFLWITSYGFLSASLYLPLSQGDIDMIYTLYEIIVIIIITWIGYRIFRDLIIYYAFDLSKKKARGDLESVLLPVIEKVGVVTIVSIGFLMVLQTLGVNVAVLLASVGVMGIIIGLAAQDTLGNFFAGIHILLDKAFRIGDLIMLEGDEDVYRVEDVGIRSTKLYNIFGHTIVYIPNSMLANHKITNLNRPDTLIRIRVDVGVSYGSDIEKVKRILQEIALEMPEVLKDEEHKPVVVFREFGDSSLNFTMYVWVDHVESQWSVGSKIRQCIMERFHREGVEIPYPQVDVHLKSS